MNREISGQEVWRPRTVEDRDAILRELQEVVASPHFCNSKRYPALLKFIVERTLAGKSDLLKERTLGVEVFNRPPTYDTNTDTIVRYTAGEVRKRLLLYYSEREHSGVRIFLRAGSYIPEFLQGHSNIESLLEDTSSSSDSNAVHMDGSAIAPPTQESIPLPSLATSLPLSTTRHSPNLSPEQTGKKSKRLLWLAFAAVTLVMVIAAARWRLYASPSRTAIDDFWGPVLHEQRAVLICTGGVVFKESNFSGVVTASKDNEYPFVSLQIASAIAEISRLLGHSGATVQLLSSPSTPLSDLREHSVILLGGYNNQWAMRLLQSQRFQLTAEPVKSIIDQTQPKTQWSRDRSIPYSSADDYALVARFRDATTGSWVVVLAGLGRNGTEAAAQFATSPYYMQLLKDQLGKDFSNRNIETVLRVQVIDGKTGAPSILAVQAM